MAEHQVTLFLAPRHRESRFEVTYATHDEIFETMLGLPIGISATGNDFIAGHVLASEFRGFPFRGCAVIRRGRVKALQGRGRIRPAIVANDYARVHLG